MQLVIEEKKENVLLSRTEVKGKIDFTGKATPSNAEVAAEIAKQVKKPAEGVRMKTIATSFGESSGVFSAYAYDNVEAKQKAEKKTKHEKEQEKKAAEEAKKKAEEEAKAKEEAKAAAEAPKAEGGDAGAEEKKEEVKAETAEKTEGSEEKKEEAPAEEKKEE